MIIRLPSPCVKGGDGGDGRGRCDEGEWDCLLSWKGEAAKARIIHGGSSAPHPSLPHNMGEGRVGGRDRRAEPRGREAYLKQYVDRPSGEPACLDAGPTASRLVAAANPRLQ